MMERGISIWTKSVEVSSRPILKEDRCVDVAVIGGGMAGVLTAYFLRNSGLHTILLESDVIGSGQTGNTTAKITFQHGLIYDRLIRQMGTEKARLYAYANRWAVGKYEQMIRRLKIDCNFNFCDSYLYTREDPNALEREYQAAHRLGIEAELERGDGQGEVRAGHLSELPFPVKAALRFPHQADFHPLKFLYTVADHMEIYEHTNVQRVKKDRIYTEKHMITAKHIVFCTHYPLANMPGFYFMRMHQERSYAIAVKNGGRIRDLYYGIDPKGLSFRPQGGELIISGGSHRTGYNCGGQYEQLVQAARQYWPECEVTAAWSAQDCMPLDGIPYIGRFSRLRPHWYVATGFQKWGMTSSMVAAQIISELIQQGESPWEQVFSPQKRHILSTPGKFCLELGESVKGLSRGLWTRMQGKRARAKLPPVCPHMGCGLKWNPDEESWDCPCHGSRFDREGKCLSNPARSGLPEEDPGERNLS